MDRVGILTWSRAHGSVPHHMLGTSIVDAMMEGAAQGCVYSKLAKGDEGASNGVTRPCGGRGSVTFSAPSEHEVGGALGVIPELQHGGSVGSVDFEDPDVQRLLHGTKHGGNKSPMASSVDGGNDDAGQGDCSSSIGSARSTGVSDTSDVGIPAAARSSSKVVPVDLSPGLPARGVKAVFRTLSDLESSRGDGVPRRQRVLPDATAAGNTPQSRRGLATDRPGHKEGSVASGSSKHSTVVIHKAIEHDAKVSVLDAQSYTNLFAVHTSILL